MCYRAVAADSTTAIRIITVTVTTAGTPNNHAPAFQALSGPFKVVKDASVGMFLTGLGLVGQQVSVDYQFVKLRIRTDSPSP